MLLVLMQLNVIDGFTSTRGWIKDLRTECHRRMGRTSFAPRVIIELWYERLEENIHDTGTYITRVHF